MENLARHPQSLVVMLGAVAAMIGLLALTRPGAHTHAKAQAAAAPAPRPVLRSSVPAVERAFARVGLRLRFRTQAPGRTTLSPLPPPWVGEDLVVVVTARGDVVLHYGGGDPQVRNRVRAAVAALRTSR
jgi:hypothetical protein